MPIRLSLAVTPNQAIRPPRTLAKRTFAQPTHQIGPKNRTIAVQKATIIPERRPLRRPQTSAGATAHQDWLRYSAAMERPPLEDLLARLREQFGAAAEPLLAALEPLLARLDLVPKAEFERLAAEIAELRAQIARLEAELMDQSEPPGTG